MKKLISLTAAVAASLFLFTPTSAEAGSYRSKVIGKCGGCGGHIHAYYRPVRLSCGQVRYSWVPSYHSNCNRVSSYRSISRYPTSRYVSRSHGYSSRSYTSRGSGISIRFGSSRGFCR